MDATANPISENSLDIAFKNLKVVLEDLVTVYRKLLDTVRKEKDFLLKAQVDELILNNKTKEELLEKISAIDSRRINAALKMAESLQLDNSTPRLLDLADAVKGTSLSDQLRHYHTTLNLLFDRLQIQNKQNEELAKNGLKTIHGAIHNIKETLSGKKTYEKKGQYKLGLETSGNFVSKEA